MQYSTAQYSDMGGKPHVYYDRVGVDNVVYIKPSCAAAVNKTKDM